MTIPLLLDAIGQFVQASTANLQLETPGGSSNPVKVHIGYLPQKMADEADASDYPFVVVRALEGQDDVVATASVKLIFGTYSKDAEGFKDTLILMERVRQALLKQRIVDGRYRMETPYKWKLHEEQAWPEWNGEAITTWTIPTIIEEAGQ